MAAENESAASDREIVSVRTFAVTRERVFRAFGDPQQLARWWGPNGFTNTIDEFDFRPDGVWRLTMHGPDGADYHNESVFLEVVPPERVVYLHRKPMHQFRMTMTYFEQDGQTTLTWRMLFDSVEDCNEFKSFIIAANEQNFDRLAEQLDAVSKQYYRGDLFPKWKHQAFVGALVFQEIKRLKLAGETVEEEEILLKGYGRVRDIKTGPEGAIYILLNEPDQVVRLTPR